MTMNRIYNKKPLIDLLSKTLDGEWGKEVADHIKYNVIRGGDFPSVRNENIDSVPKHFIENRKANTVFPTVDLEFRLPLFQNMITYFLFSQ